MKKAKINITIQIVLAIIAAFIIYLFLLKMPASIPSEKKDASRSNLEDNLKKRLLELEDERMKNEMELKNINDELNGLYENYLSQNNAVLNDSIVDNIIRELERITEENQKLEKLLIKSNKQLSQITKSQENKAPDSLNKLKVNYSESNNYEALAQKIDEEIDQEAISTELEIEMKIERLKQKPFIFAIEDKMFLEKKYECFARIGNIYGLDSLASEIKSEISESQILIRDSIEVDVEMSMDLYGKHFKIERISKDKQLLVSDEDFTEWKWYVTPTEADSQMLEVHVYAYIYIDGNEKSHKVNVYKKSVDVKVGFVNGTKLFLKKNWEWIATAFVPLILFGYNKRSNISALSISAKNGTIRGFSSGFSWVSSIFQNISEYAKKTIGKK